MLPFSEIREEYIAASNIWNRTLLFTENDKQFKGQAIDLDYDGYLIVRDEAGESHRLISADIDFNTKARRDSYGYGNLCRCGFGNNRQPIRF